MVEAGEPGAGAGVGESSVGGPRQAKGGSELRELVDQRGLAALWPVPW